MAQTITLIQELHVVPGLIHKFYQAHINNDEQCEVWGSGTPLREFLLLMI